MVALENEELEEILEDLNTKKLVLLDFIEREGRTTNGQIADYLGLNKSSASYQVDTLDRFLLQIPYGRKKFIELDNEFEEDFKEYREENQQFFGSLREIAENQDLERKTGDNQ